MVYSVRQGLGAVTVSSRRRLHLCSVSEAEVHTSQIGLSNTLSPLCPHPPNPPRPETEERFFFLKRHESSRLS